ncbi:hypothetical protein sS8_4911 [Methylocaldum marinum]|uniref:Uncharacterized protein n=1 Tax=Methylocaldum marinum TaxID=1432792 RepID=A0A250KZB8_9GAMM|nr:hypothetical protein sS8_4911 [Methylocaldum marinum]
MEVDHCPRNFRAPQKLPFHHEHSWFEAQLGIESHAEVQLLYEIDSSGLRSLVLDWAGQKREWPRTQDATGFVAQKKQSGAEGLQVK